MNRMTYELQGSGGSHMSPTWDSVWKLCEESDCVSSYDESEKTIEWCDGTSETFASPQSAINTIHAMSQS